MAGCNRCIDEVPEAYIQKYRTQGRQSPRASPGAIEMNADSVLFLLGGFALGCVATVIFVNVSGETSFTGLARKTTEYGKRGYTTLESAWGK